MWRRVAGGLNASLQKALFDRLRPVLLPGKGKDVAKPAANELAEMWRAAASLERLDVKQKEALGQALLKPLPPQPGADLRLLGADAARRPRAALRPAQRRACIRRSSRRWLDASSASSRATTASGWPGRSAWRSSPAAAASAPSTWTTAIARAC